MYDGKVEQVGTPFEIYNRPSTRFVASFVGTLNILNATVANGELGTLTIDGQKVVAKGIPTDLAAGSARSVALRPEALCLNGVGDKRNRLDGTVEEVEFLGSVVRIRVRFKDNAVSMDTFNNPNAPPPKLGAPVTVSFAPEDLLVLDAPELA
jgi:putative spermidine/putrescine transport system ATP-binding protein